MSITGDYQARLEAWSDIQGHMPFLHASARERPGAVIIELGTRSGNSTAAFLAAAAAAGGDVWSADIAPPDVPPAWHDLACWHFLQADDRTAAALEWLPARCDILFIDTSHQYEHTLEELRLYVPRVRPGGLVLMHDTELAPDGDPGGEPHVARALDAYCGEARLEWENMPGSWGLGVIRR